MNYDIGQRKGPNPLSVSGGVDTTKTGGANTKRTQKVEHLPPQIIKKGSHRTYTVQEMYDLLQGRISISRDMWSFIPVNSYICYIKKHEPTTPPDVGRAANLVYGGYVVHNTQSKKGEAMFIIGTKPTHKSKEEGYITFPAKYDNIAEVWKKYADSAFIEIHLILNSLTRKNEQITSLQQEILRLKERVDALERS